MRVALATPMRAVDAISDILGITPIKVGAPPPMLGGIATDSREVLAGDLFVALSGARRDGNSFVAEALSHGAAAVLSEKDLFLGAGSYWSLRAENAERALLALARARRRLTRASVIAISGSTGKTTVKEIVAAVLGEVGRVERSVGNFNSGIGMPLSLLGMEEADHFVLEIGINHPGEMEPLARALAPDLAILTNVGSAHIGHFSDHHALLAEKMKISAGQTAADTLLLADSIPREAWRNAVPRVLTLGVGEKADFRVLYERHCKAGVTADIAFGDQVIPRLKWPVPGSIGVSCLAFGTAVGLLFGASAEQIAQGLLTAAAQLPRMHSLEIAGRTVIDDTYNASPEAMVGALEALCYISGTCPRAAVLGDIGELGTHAAALHAAVGECAGHSGLAQLFTYGDHALEMANGARRGMPHSAVHAFPFGAENTLAQEILRLVPRGGVILFKASRKTALERVIKKLGREL